ncbi:TetR/AcrR family transcriptional regulator [Sphingobium estronivorans]|uniref:TetR/AcrR family transcriptional regulator n=1 Tax=Sphingobium estronivorans TaxID=1577690 RepID=UPI001F088234|nr:TetR/AcrR family transcriptional regulator [Sphingobium estronivorans]
MAMAAACADNPRERVAQFLKLHFDHYISAFRGEVRPIAILSEIRALDDPVRSLLFARFQALFRTVRAFFGPVDDEVRKSILTARTQTLIEAIFWSDVWMRQYALSDLDNVRQRLFDLLDGGIAARPQNKAARIFDIMVEPPTDGRPPFLKSAIKLINDMGYKGASIDRIAGDINLTKGSFYHHLEAKDDLILECFRDSYRRLGYLRQAAQETCESRWDVLRSIVASAVALQFEGHDPLLRTTALQALPLTMRAGMRELSNRTAMFLSGLVVDAMREGHVRVIDPYLAGHLIMSTINSANELRSWASRLDRSEAVTRYASVIEIGIFDD